jgi:hypothetical protein
MAAPCDACQAGVHCFGPKCPCCCREPEGDQAGARRILCAHADQDGKGAHWLAPGEKCAVATAAEAEARAKVAGTRAELEGGHAPACGCPVVRGAIFHQRRTCSDPVAARLGWYASDKEATEPAAASPDAGKLDAIRGVLDLTRDALGFDDTAPELTDALQQIDQIAGSSRTASGIEPGGSAHIASADVQLVLGALAAAADLLERQAVATWRDGCESSPSDLCPEHLEDLDQATAYRALRADLLDSCALRARLGAS